MSESGYMTRVVADVSSATTPIEFTMRSVPRNYFQGHANGSTTGGDANRVAPKQMIVEEFLAQLRLYHLAADDEKRRLARLHYFFVVITIFNSTRPSFFIIQSSF